MAFSAMIGVICTCMGHKLWKVNLWMQQQCTSCVVTGSRTLKPACAETGCMPDSTFVFTNYFPSMIIVPLENFDCKSQCNKCFWFFKFSFMSLFISHRYKWDISDVDVIAYQHGAPIMIFRFSCMIKVLQWFVRCVCHLHLLPSEREDKLVKCHTMWH